MLNNKFNEKFEHYQHEATKAKDSEFSNIAVSKFEDKPYYKENRVKYYVAKIASCAFNLCSVFTAFFAISYFLNLTLGNVASYLLSAIIVLCIEVLKNSNLQTLYKDVLKYKKYNIPTILLCIALVAISVLSSALGASIIVDLSSEKEQIVYNIDSLEYSSISAKIQANNSEISDLLTQKKANGQLSSSTKVIIQQKQNYVAELESSLIVAKDKMDAEKAKQDSDFAEQKSAKSANNDTIKLVIVALSISFELFLLLCSFYCSYYLFRVYVDSSDKTSIGATIQKQSIGFNNRNIVANEAETAINSFDRGDYNNIHANISLAFKAIDKDDKIKAKQAINRIKNIVNK